MATKLWTLHFMRICLANLLLFISLYLLYPVLPVMMASRLGVPVSQTGVIFIFFTLAMFFIGPFHAYLVDVDKRIWRGLETGVAAECRFPVRVLRKAVRK